MLVLGKGLTQKINKQTVYADHTIPTNFTATDKKFCLSLHYDGFYGRLFGNGKKQVNSEIKQHKVCLGKISSDFSAVNAAKTGLYGSVYDFSVDYRIISYFEVYDIHRYLMKKNYIV